jgi:hypothetical protein
MSAGESATRLDTRSGKLCRAGCSSSGSSTKMQFSLMLAGPLETRAVPQLPAEISRED